MKIKDAKKPYEEIQLNVLQSNFSEVIPPDEVQDPELPDS